MSTPSNPLQAGIYSRLVNYAPLTALIGSSKVFDFVPETAVPPFVKIGEATAISDYTKSNRGWQYTITIHAWTFEVAGTKAVNAIMSAIHDALDRQESNITVAGFSLIQIECEFEQTFQEPTAEGQGDRFYHGVQRYRALIKA